MRWLLLPLALLVTLASPASAHDTRPVSLNIREITPGTYQLDFTVPGSVPEENLPSAVLPATCKNLGAGGYRPDIAKRVTRQTFNCPDGLAGAKVGLHFPLHNPSLTQIFRAQFLSGANHSAILGPQEASWQIPEAETASLVSAQYFWLGVDHILGGYDHLLFLLAMLMIARTLGRIVLTITGFTLAHSVTLGLTALGWIGVPVPLVETLIAFSIVFVASEIARGDQTTLTYRYPIVVTGLFGLLHGFGFARALSEIGLPQTQLPLALLMFNIGIEAGQLTVVALVLGFAMLITGLASWPLARAEKGLAYCVGTLAAFWFVERFVSTTS